MASRPFQTRQQPPPVPDLSGTKKRVTFVHNQYNSPLGLYSPAEVADTLNRHTRLLDNGAVGIDFALLAAPNLARSEVYKMLNEEEKPTSPSYIDQRQIQQEQFNCTTIPADEVNNKKRVAWPPVETSSNNNDEICQSIEAPFLQQKLPARHQVAAVSATKVAPPVPPKPANPTINPKDSYGKSPASTVIQNYSTIKPEPLKRQILVGRPLVNEPLNQSQPKKQIKYGSSKMGNVIWPPKTNMSQEELGVSSQTGAFRCQTKDYQDFFNQHQLQPTYPAYRAPPGTQRVAGAKKM